MLNTPVEECDPELLRLIVLAFAHYLAETLPPELGMTDVQAVLAELWRRMGGPQAEAAPDSAATEQPHPGSAAASDALPEPQAARAPVGAAIPVTAVPSTRRYAAVPRITRLYLGQLCRCCRALLHRRARSRRPDMPHPRFLFYAACAGPP